MPNATPISDPRRNTARHAGVVGVALLAVLLPTFAHAQPSPDRGYVLKVPSALDTRWIETHKKFIDNRLDRFEKERAQDARFKLICDFNPENAPSACDDIFASAKLARYLREWRDRGVLTVAWVHDETTRHSVLPVLACSEIVFADKALGPPDKQRYPALGQVSKTPLNEEDRAHYERIIGGRWSAAIIRKMYDPTLVVVKVRDGVPGDRYRDLNDKPRPDGELVATLGRDSVALYTYRDAVEYGLCEKTALNSLNDVLANYGLSSTTSLYDAPQQTIAWRVVVSGALNADLRERTERRIHRALGQKANLIILQLECHGGDGDHARRLAQFILERNKDRSEPVHFIAFVTPQARDTAAFLMFACHETVFHAEAELGFEQFIKKQPHLEGTLREGLVKVAEQSVHPYILAEGMLSRDLRIHAVASRGGDSRRKYMSEADYLQDQASDKPQWESKEVVKPASARKEDQERYLTLTADRARKLGLIAEDASVRSFEELCGNHGLDPKEVQTADTDWLGALGDFLRNPWTSVVLVMIGITCLILELKMPGVSLPGVIAAICFVLFFWAHSGLADKGIGVLAILLFALGLLLVGLEVFVLPGFGVPGVSGVLLMFGSVGLVAYGHWPRSNAEWLGFGKTLSPFGISILGAVVSAYFLAKYLPHVPYVNKLFLKPPSEQEEEGEPEPLDAARAELAGLLGAIGVAATPLRPAGKVQFGEQFVDVVAESGYVEPGTRVQVVEIEGNRVVVKEV